MTHGHPDGLSSGYPLRFVEDADGWVGNRHAWLASLGYLPMVRWVAVTVDTAPEPGTTLQGAVLPRIRAEAPADVQHLLREIVARSPADNYGISTYRGPGSRARVG